MANNNLVLTIVIVAAAFLLFNGGLSGQVVYQQSCAKDGSTYCKGGDIYKCENGLLVHQQTCTSGEDCFTTQMGGYTTSPQASYCLKRVSGSTMPSSFAGPRYA